MFHNLLDALVWLTFVFCCLKSATAKSAFGQRIWIVNGIICLVMALAVAA